MNGPVGIHPPLVVFDLDGTLIDSAPDIREAVNRVLAPQGIAPLSLMRIRSFIGGGVALLWQRIIHATGLDPAQKPELVARFMAHYQAATGLTRIYPGVESALHQLTERGCRLGICTNKPLAPAQAVLSDLGLAGYFAHVVGGDSLPLRKPDPAPLRAAFAGLGGDPAAPLGIYVGDSEFDALCAASLELPFLLYTKGYRQKPVAELPHHASFDDWSLLPGLVGSLLQDLQLRPAICGQ